MPLCQRQSPSLKSTNLILWSITLSWSTSRRTFRTGSSNAENKCTYTSVFFRFFRRYLFVFCNLLQYLSSVSAILSLSDLKQLFFYTVKFQICNDISWVAGVVTGYRKAISEEIASMGLEDNPPSGTDSDGYRSPTPEASTRKAVTKRTPKSRSLSRSSQSRSQSRSKSRSQSRGAVTRAHTSESKGMRKQ